MLPCNKILCAIDFSEASFEALKAANELAQGLSSELLLVHVVPSVSWPADLVAAEGCNMECCQKQLVEDARRKLDEAARTRVPDSVTRRVILKEGDPGHEILQTAEEESVNLIVIATHGMSSWHHYVHGAVAQRVIQHTPCAVLVVRRSLHRKHAPPAGE